jgi:hypothetical protein
MPRACQGRSSPSAGAKALGWGRSQIESTTSFRWPGMIECGVEWHKGTKTAIGNHIIEVLALFRGLSQIITGS